MKSRRTKEERQAIVRRVFEALCAHYPDRYVVLIEQPGDAKAALQSTALLTTNAITDRP